MAVDAASLLEWVASLEVFDQAIGRLQDLEDLRDGEVLLQVMHDVSPQVFPTPGPGASNVRRLLEGLRKHFRGRTGTGEACAWSLLQQEATAGVAGVDVSLMVQLVIWATIHPDNDHSKQTRYVQACEQLSRPSQEAVMDIVQRFQASSLRQGPGGSGNVRSGAEDAEDFMEVGLDDETRYRRLKKHYVATMDQKERLEEELNFLRRELEVEQEKRRAAEEAETSARAELRLADEARDRLKEDQRALFEVRLEQELRSYREQAVQREQEIEELREKLREAQSQAKDARRMSGLVEQYKKRIEEGQAWKRERDELKQQLEDVLSNRQSGSGDMERLHARLARSREEASEVAHERDEAQRKVEVLRQALEQTQHAQQAAEEELDSLREQLAAREAEDDFPLEDVRGQRRGAMAPPPLGDLAFEPGSPVTASSFPPRSPEAGSSHAPRSPQGASSKPAPRSPGSNNANSSSVEEIRQLLQKGTSSSVEEIRQLLHGQKDDLLERLLEARDKATRAETTLKLKQDEVAALTEQRLRDASKLATLEERLRNSAALEERLQSQAEELQARVRDAQQDAARRNEVGAEKSEAEKREAERRETERREAERRDAERRDAEQEAQDSTQAHDLKALLAQRERELQVHRWRGQAESDSLLAQETLMVSCFHELGLRYHKLRMQNEELQRRLEHDARRGGSNSRLAVPQAGRSAALPNRSAAASQAALPSRSPGKLEAPPRSAAKVEVTPPPIKREAPRSLGT